MTNDQAVTISIDYTKIPKTHIKKATNGKLYFACEVQMRQTPDQYGNNLNVKLPWERGKDAVYLGNARLWNFKEAKDSDFTGYLELSVCLSDIDKSRMVRSGDRLYFNIEVTKRKEPDNYGNDLTIAVSRTKEERESGVVKVYCGSGKIRKTTQAVNDSDLADFDLSNFEDRSNEFSAGNTGVNTPPDDDLPF